MTRDVGTAIGLRDLTDNEGMIALCDYLPSFQDFRAILKYIISGGGEGQFQLNSALTNCTLH